MAEPLPAAAEPLPAAAEPLPAAAEPLPVNNESPRSNSSRSPSSHQLRPAGSQPAVTLVQPPEEGLQLRVGRLLPPPPPPPPPPLKNRCPPGSEVRRRSNTDFSHRFFIPSPLPHAPSTHGSVVHTRNQASSGGAPLETEPRVLGGLSGRGRPLLEGGRPSEEHNLNPAAHSFDELHLNAVSAAGDSRGSSLRGLHPPPALCNHMSTLPGGSHRPPPSIGVDTDRGVHTGLTAQRHHPIVASYRRNQGLHTWLCRHFHRVDPIHSTRSVPRTSRRAG